MNQWLHILDLYNNTISKCMSNVIYIFVKYDNSVIIIIYSFSLLLFDISSLSKAKEETIVHVLFVWYTYDSLLSIT